MCSIPFSPYSIRSHPPCSPCSPLDVALMYYTLRVWASGGGSERKGSRVGLGWSEGRAWCSGVPDAKRKGVRPRGCAQIAFFLSFFGSLEACMGRSGCSDYLFPLVLYPPLLFSRSPSRFFLFRTSGRLPFFVSLLSPLLSLSTFSSFALVSISLTLSLSMSIFSLRRYTPPICSMGLTFLSRFFLDQQPSTRAYTRGTKIRPPCSMDL
jgi:hypothetical protein